ncbi:MAG: type VI secretion system baseplate subunit TssK [Kiloniellaceae bacterium]
MSQYNKVVWSEGMFLRPHHFQQQDRYFENLIGHCATGQRPHAWGFSELKIDRELLQTGKFALAQCRGVTPDGTLFNLPEEADLPKPLDLTEEVEDCTVFLALPSRATASSDVDVGDVANGTARYQVRESEVRDSSGRNETLVPIHVGRLRFRLMLESEDRRGYHCLGLARIVQVGADKSVVFDEGYIPPCIDCQVSPGLGGFLNELLGLLHQRGDSLAGRVSESGRGGAAEIADFLLLQLVNRYEPLVAHLAKLRVLHPEALYRMFLTMAGELATFALDDKRPPGFSEYRHDALKETFEPVKASLRRSLSMVLERNAIAIPLDERKYGIRVAELADRSLLTQASFVLAVGADVPAERLRGTFPGQVKIGPVEKIRELVNLALPGIPLSPLPAAPRQIPYHAGVTYFQLDTSHAFWKQLQQSGGLAFHVSGKYPDLEMTFWAIKK